jgi:hypothetical protein
MLEFIWEGLSMAYLLMLNPVISPHLFIAKPSNFGIFLHYVLGDRTNYEAVIAIFLLLKNDTVITLQVKSGYSTAPQRHPGWSSTLLLFSINAGM